MFYWRKWNAWNSKSNGYLYCDTIPRIMLYSYIYKKNLQVVICKNESLKGALP